MLAEKTQTNYNWTRDARRETRDARRETRDARRETRDARRETRDARRETRDARREKSAFDEPRGTKSLGWHPLGSQIAKSHLAEPRDGLA